jgi:hypothetical protein
VSDHDDKPSKQVVLQCIRNRIIEYLDGISSREWAEKNKHVSSTYVVDDAVNQWDDWVRPGWRDYLIPPVFSIDEQDAISSYHTTLENVDDSISNALPDILRDTPEWEDLRRQAERSLSVFLERGRFSDDEEVQFSGADAAPPAGR